MSQILDFTLATEGYAILEDVVSLATVESLRSAIDTAVVPGNSGRSEVRPHAVRNLLKLPAVRSLAESEAILASIGGYFSTTPQAVRAILFDKNPDANWKVAWHQDLSIAIQERIDVAGFGPWSMKQGVQHVQPPVELLERMLTVRLHLDDCLADNGPLRVLPGSQAMGVLSSADVSRLRTETPAVDCLVPAGGAVLMRPLILHASSAATTPTRRRVIHIEYSADALPGGLTWCDW